jgi:hypothetical protein
LDNIEKVFCFLTKKKQKMLMPKSLSVSETSVTTHTGLVLKGMPLYTVLSSEELISSGPYFSSKQEALEWGFLHYYSKGVIFPDIINKPIQSWEVSENSNPQMNMENALYLVTPPLLAEIYLDDQYPYQNAGLPIHNTGGFNTKGPSVNSEASNLDAGVLEFYNPVSDKMHTGKVAKYRISVKYPNSIFILNKSESLSPDMPFINGWHNGVVSRANMKHDLDTYTWRFYDPLYISAPQNIIERQYKISIDWPNILLRSLNAMTLMANQNRFQLSYIEKIVWDSGKTNYLGGSVQVFSAMKRLDVVVTVEILKRLNSLQDAINLFSINKKMKRWFNENVNIQLTVWKLFGPRMSDYFSHSAFAMGDYNFRTPSLISTPIKFWDVPKETSGTKHKIYKLFKAGLCLDYDDILEISSQHQQLNHGDALKIVRTLNGSCISIAHVMSLMYDVSSESIKTVIIEMYGGANIGFSSRRHATVPSSPSVSTSGFFQRSTPKSATPNELVGMMKPNDSWAFDILPSCFGDLENVQTVLKGLEVQTRDGGNSSYSVSFMWRFYDDNGIFISDIELVLAVKPSTSKHSATILLGPLTHPHSDPGVMLLHGGHVEPRGYNEENEETFNIVIRSGHQNPPVELGSIYVKVVTHLRLMFLFSGAYRVDTTLTLL